MRAWVATLLIAASLYLAPGFAAQAGGMHRLELNCPDNSDPDIAALCTVLHQRLIRDGASMAGDVVAHLRGHGLTGPGLVAQLVVTRDGRRYATPEMTLTVMDRGAIPRTQLRRFADDLIAGLTPSKD